MKKFKEKAEDYFARHPSNNECHITSDGRVFHTKGTALGFAGTLDSQEIESYSRKVLEKDLKISEDNELPEKASKAERIAMEVFLKQNEVEKMKYEDLKKLIKFFDLKTEDQKAETLITALTELKNTLNQQ